MCNTSLSVGIIGIYTVRHSASEKPTNTKTAAKHGNAGVEQAVDNRRLALVYGVVQLA